MQMESVKIWPPGIVVIVPFVAAIFPIRKHSFYKQKLGHVLFSVDKSEMWNEGVKFEYDIAEQYSLFFLH